MLNVIWMNNNTIFSFKVKNPLNTKLDCMHTQRTVCSHFNPSDCNFLVLSCDKEGSSLRYKQSVCLEVILDRCCPGLNCQLSGTLRGTRFHFIEMHMVSASDELAQCGLKQADKKLNTTQIQACMDVDIPTPSLDPSCICICTHTVLHWYMHTSVCWRI